MKTIVDTSVWIAHFRKANEELIELLAEDSVLIHSSVVGELACGEMKERSRILSDLKLLPRAEEVPFAELLDFIETHRLFGQGLSWVDVQLLASAMVSEARIFTLDKALAKAARN